MPPGRVADLVVKMGGDQAQKALYGIVGTVNLIGYALHLEHAASVKILGPVFESCIYIVDNSELRSNV
jgi:hypothetical protein